MRAMFTGGKVCRGWASLNGCLNQRSPGQSPIFFDKKMMSLKYGEKQ